MTLITTGGGKVGQHVVTQLAQKKAPTRAGFHSQAKAAEARETGIEAVVLDFESRESLATAFRGIDTLFLVSPGSGCPPGWWKRSAPQRRPPTFPGDQSSAEVERVLHRKPRMLEQFLKDYRGAF